MAEEKLIEVIEPQEGYQMKALSSPADIVIGGGAAGTGKTFVLLLDPLHYITEVKGFGGVIFRRTYPQITSEGGLWDASMKLYPASGATPNDGDVKWTWKKNGNKLKFSHLQHEKDVRNWQGTEIPFIGFDELTHFTEKMFFYLLTRNRSTCGVRPYVRATCNPDPESWVATLIEWWIDQDTGYPIPERDGVLRYFIKSGDNYVWGDTFEEVREQASHIIDPIVKDSKGLTQPNDLIKSITFIGGSVFDNKKLLSADPGYVGNLLSQDEATMNQLLKGNWKEVISDLDVYNYASFIGMFENFIACTSQHKFITADIAMMGSNKFIVGYWNGKLLEDIAIVSKSKGNDVVDKIVEFAKKYKVPNNHIIYDADGVGAFVDGFIKGAVPFHGGAQPIKVKDETTERRQKEDYFNLKTQCFYRQGAAVDRGEYRISDEVADRMYDDKMTVRQRFMFERKAIKRDKVDEDGKLRVIPKEDMKIKLNGQSPDMMDMMMMREYFVLKPPRQFFAV